MPEIHRASPRKVTITPHTNPYAHGSAIVEFGNTKVHVTAFVEDSVPSFLKNSGKGWVTAEYSMLPGSTHTRSRRERSKVGGRTSEIQRLIGRSLRSIVDFEVLGERSIVVDCDVLVADGGTRTASISGAYVALSIAIKKLLDEKALDKNPLSEALGAISVGINSEHKIVADLNYEEDSTCEIDMNVVMTESGRFVEVQGTAEGAPFERESLDGMLDCARDALQEVFKAQKAALS